MTFRIPFIALALAGPSPAEELYTGPFGEGGTWNLYQTVSNSTTWDEARRLAETMKPPVGNPEAKGHLVTLSSIAENDFMRLVSDRRSVWCGLTDNERFGGHEAGSHPRNGWKWITGEPLTFSNWKPVEPDDWSDVGEDAVFIERYGRWSDGGTGTDGQSSTMLDFIVEWETRSPKPVEGAIPLTKAWPDEVVMPAPLPGKWNARWANGYCSLDALNVGNPHSIPQAALLLTNFAVRSGKVSLSKQTALIQSQGNLTAETPWLWLATPDVNRQGWLPGDGRETENFTGLPPRSPYVGAVIGKIHVEKAGTYTFAITAEEAFALRIGGLKWKSASGDGYIDPLDPLVITQPYSTFSTKALGVMDLPAGDHLVEAMWMVETTGSEFHVLSAPGVHLTEGSTTDWRPLGHRMSNEAVPTLGITDAGWTIDCSPPQLPRKDGPQVGLEDGAIKLALDLGCISKSGLKSINFSDAPETNITHFPDALNFPNAIPNRKNDNWPLRARARLVVPEDGTYQIGVHASGLATLRIKGGALSRFPQTSQGSKGLKIREDSFEFDGRTDSNSEPKIVSEWHLAKGEYDIEMLYVKNSGTASLAVFSGPPGPYGPGLLTTGGAKLSADLPGLPHASR